MVEPPLKSLAAYSRYLAELLPQHSTERSTLRVWSDSPYTGIAEGEVLFARGFRLRVREELDFAAGLITSYGYEVYLGDERLYSCVGGSGLPAKSHPIVLSYNSVG
jgi:hypothetical protein